MLLLAFLWLLVVALAGTAAAFVQQTRRLQRTCDLAASSNTELAENLRVLRVRAAERDEALRKTCADLVLAQNTLVAFGDHIRIVSEALTFEGAAVPLFPSAEGSSLDVASQ